MRFGLTEPCVFFDLVGWDLPGVHLAFDADERLVTLEVDEISSLKPSLVEGRGLGHPTFFPGLPGPGQAYLPLARRFGKVARSVEVYDDEVTGIGTVVLDLDARHRIVGIAFVGAQHAPAGLFTRATILPPPPTG